MSSNQMNALYKRSYYMTRNVTQQHLDRILKPLPINKGGTSAKTANQARINLSGLSLTRIGQPGGVTPLSGVGKIPLQYLPIPDINSVSVNGPSFCYLGRTTHYTITDYDTDTVYPVSCSDGTININKDNISYTPATLGNHTFTVKDKTYNIRCILIPVLDIVSPANNSQPDLPIAFTLSLDSVLRDIDHIPLDRIQWEISTDINFTTIVATTNIDVPAGTTDILNFDGLWSPSELLAGTEYWVRVRILPLNEAPGGWSATIHFTTNVDILPKTQSAIIHRPDIADGILGGQFGFAMAMSPDGTILAISDEIADNGSVPGNGFYAGYPSQTIGIVYIYKLINNVWELFTTLNNGYSDSAFYQFGNSICISSDNDGILVGSYSGRTNNWAGNNIGLIQIYQLHQRNQFNRVYALHYIDAINGYSGMHAANTIRLSSDGLVLARTEAGVKNVPERVVITRFDGVNNYDVNPVQIINPHPSEQSEFAKNDYSIDLSSDGTRLVVHDPVGDLNDWGQGCCYIYDYNGSNWNLTHVIKPPIINTYEEFGGSPKLSSDGNTLAVTAFVSNTNDRGCVFIYEYQNSTWNLAQILNHPDWDMDTLGGFPYCMVFSNDGNCLYIGSPWQTALESHLGIVGVHSYDGAVMLFKKSNGVWSFNHKYIAPDLNPIQGTQYGAYFGHSIVVNPTNTELIIGAFNKLWDGNTSDNGAIYIYR